MSTRLSTIIVLILIGLAAVGSAILYPLFPEPMASHWNASGEVNGYMTRFWGAFLMPVMSLGLFLLFWIVPVIDPLKANIARFREYFNAFIVLIMAFLLYIHGLTLAWNLGFTYNMNIAIIPAVGLIFVFAGVMMGKARRNFFIGIRTPWTLSSDRVWDETHRLGSRLFIASGIITMLAVFLGEAGLWLFLPVILIAALVPVVYSYILWRREEKAK